ncbi:MAG TPA: cation:proton antiporter [Flavobacteriales bacterium]|nr:cation:proton antiporter [Flavobacteriales bacterium]
MNNPYYILIALSVLVIVSYVFNILSSKLRIPSVILLLATGIFLNYAAKEFDYEVPDFRILLELLGITGLIFIVLEGTLDLKLEQKKLPVIRKSILSATLILCATAGIICYIFMEFLSLPLRNAIVYAVPLGVISSAIAIPSVHKLLPEQKEFIVYESTFSDIIGIMVFNYVVLDNVLSGAAVLKFFTDLLIIMGVSFASTAFLLVVLNYTRSHVKFYLIFAVLILVYSLSKMFHLPSLLLILIFGLMLNNAKLYIKGRLARYLQIERLAVINRELKLITAETAFIIRTFFFVLFGFSINLQLLNDSTVLLVGSLIILTITVTRFVFLRFISHANLFPGIFIAPRGLITIVLFYSIPAGLQTSLFNEGILFFVIIVSSLLMMAGLLVTKTNYKETMNELNT